jgi:HSP20 family protein
MNNIMKREGANAPATFGSVVDQIFQKNLTRFFDDSFWGFDGRVSRSHVPVNIRETDAAYEIELVAPGLRKQDFNLNVAGDSLTISFEQHAETNQENKQEGWLRQEYRKESFSRSFNLDDTIDAVKISARYEDGILHVTLPKKENAQKISKTIEIQ